jgi:hypothetical protein
MVEYNFNHPFNDTNCCKRLIEEYEEHGKLVIGFDFDNTIFDCHNNGGNYSDVISLLKKCKELGFILCLFTAELNPEWINWKIKYCEHFGIKPDYINESPIMNGTKKPVFNILLDDRAGLESTFRTLINLLIYIEDKKTIDNK